MHLTLRRRILLTLAPLVLLLLGLGGAGTGLILNLGDRANAILDVKNMKGPQDDIRPAIMFRVEGHFDWFGGKGAGAK